MTLATVVLGELGRRPQQITITSPADLPDVGL